VEEVGPDVTLVKPGDHVVLSFAPYCGHCFYCSIGRPVLCDNMRITMGKGPCWMAPADSKKGGKPLYHMAGLSSFAQYAVVAEISCIKIADNVPL
jgi:Zn-dependent alcohol dehydrogenase